MLASSVSELKGVGEKLTQAFARVGIRTVGDLIDWLPRRHEDFSAATSIAQLEPGKVTILARCEKVETRQVRRGLRVTTATLTDGKDKIRAVWFNQPYRATQLSPDQEFLFSGTFEFTYNRYQLTNPAVEKPRAFAEAEPTEFLAPIYRVIKDVKPQQLRKLIESVRPTMVMLPETLPQSVIETQKLLSRGDAYVEMHFPSSEEALARAKERLAFEELFELLMASQLNKRENSKLQGWEIPFEQPRVAEFVKNLPFPLTGAQRRAAWQIIQDFASNEPMNRLLQGDVGSGKTVVAGLAAYSCAQAGLQTAIMAPTEILASQHAETLHGLLASFGMKVALLTGSVKGAARKTLLQELSNGKIDVIVGTHALIQKTVHYHKLGFVVIDEQHRFGVKQRQALLEKSPHMPHLLAMTATPIPRSLQLTVFGELEVSVLDELPAGRRPIATKIWQPTSAETLYEKIDVELAAGRQAYIICSLIDENPENDVKSVEAEYRKLRSTVFRHRTVGLLHGKLSAAEKEAVMQQFADGKVDILVSTTVVEVGVNVPNATVILIENADRFGLSQLHQLRGRVGRSSYQSYCHLVTSDNKKPTQRLREIEKSNDGFYLAEVDLKLRGPGEIYGRMQHGALNLRIATLADTKLIARAQAETKRFIDSGEDLVQYKQLSSRVHNYQRLTTLN
ncbi:MAG: ATP-dependent DNA helicase RecG [Candidatus Saccharimonadales bacterium]